MINEPSTRAEYCRNEDCGWYREYEVGGLRDTVIDHPQWGAVTNYVAAMNDISTHRCKTYRAARTTMREVVGRWKTAHAPA